MTTKEMTKEQRHAAAQKKYAEQQKSEGKRRMCVWLPEEALDDFQKAVSRIRKKWGG